MSALERLRLYARVARAEGLRSAFERSVDRFDEWRQRRSLRVVSADEWRRVVRGVSVLNLLPTPPSVRLGGVQIQLARRMEAEARLRACALLFPDRGSWRLEAWPARVALRLGGDAPGVLGREVRFEEVVRRAVDLTGAGAVHVENVAGLPLESLACLAEDRLALIVSLHDFAPFCPRPLLIERPAGRFCGYSRDAARCAACLLADGSGDARAIEARRAAGARLLRAARALVFPSEFLRARLSELVTVPESVVQAVIAPASGVTRVAPDATRSPGLHVAFVGPARVEKGALVFEQVLGQIAAAASRAPARRADDGPRRHADTETDATETAGVVAASGARLRWSAYGGGDADTLLRLRARGVYVHGYYRAGSLSRRLVADRVDVALLLSIGPESYGLTLDECAAAGVPVIVFDVGAPAERVRAWNAGVVVSLDAGAEGIVEALARRLTSRDAALSPGHAIALPAAASAAQAHIDLYARAGLDPGHRGRG